MMFDHCQLCFNVFLFNVTYFRHVTVSAVGLPIVEMYYEQKCHSYLHEGRFVAGRAANVL